MVEKNEKELLAQFDVLPLYGQVAIWDAETTDWPEDWTEEGCTTHTQTVLLIATRGDWEGTVNIRVWNKKQNFFNNLIFEGGIENPSGKINIGSYLAEDFMGFGVNPSQNTRLRVYAPNSMDIDLVDVVLTQVSNPN